MGETKRLFIIIGGVVIVLLLVGGIFLIKGKKQEKQPLQNEPLQNEEVIPTVDSSVKIDLESLPGKKEVVLSVKNIPAQTDSIEYEISYDAVGQGPQGAIGQCYKVRPERESCDFFQLSNGKKITLGTCSSGTCVYHTVTGPVRLFLKFIGKYGEKIFEKEYTL